VCALTIRPPRTVTSTCTGPYCVSTTPPAATTELLLGVAVLRCGAGGLLERGEGETLGRVDGEVAGCVDGEVVGTVRLPLRLDCAVDVCLGCSELTAAGPTPAEWVRTLAPNATATTAVVATVISCLVPRLTHILLSPREPFLMQLRCRQPARHRGSAHRVHPPIRTADIHVVPLDSGHDLAQGILVGP
jgi:hypothetical protein